jgi:hypothetical protein
MEGDCMAKPLPISTIALLLILLVRSGKNNPDLMDFGQSTFASFVQSLTLHIGRANITGCFLRFIGTRRSALAAIHGKASFRSPSIILRLIASFRGCHFPGLTWADNGIFLTSEV